MPSFFPLQTAFNGGEVSGRVRGRTDLDLYKKALSLCENFEPLAQGSLRMRAGSEHALALTGDARTRLLQFRMVNGQDYLLELYDHVMRLYTIDGAQAAPVLITALQMIENGDFTLGGTGWTGIGGSFDTVNGRADLDTHGHGAGPDLWIRQKVVVTQAAASGTLRLSVIPMDAAARVHVTLDMFIHDGAHVGLLVDATVDPDDPAIPNSGSSSMQVLEFATGAIPADRDLYVTIENLIEDSRFIVDNVELVLESPPGAGADVPTPWSADDLAGLNVTADTGLDRAIFTHSAYAPYFLKFNGGNNWEFHVIGFASRPEEWGEEWPSICEFSKGRTWWSGLSTAKNRIWGSVVGDPFNIALATGPGDPPTVLPSDAIDEKIATNGAIQWLHDSTALLIGSDLGEHSVSGSKGTPLNGDIFTRRESSYGSCGVQAIDVGDLVVYVSTDRLRVRGIEYNLETDKWKSTDLLFAAEHIVAADSVNEIHHAWTPDGVLLCVLASGKLGVCSYNPEEKVTAWWRCTLSSGAVRSAAISRGSSGAYLWMAVERGGVMFLERLPLSESVAALAYLDASVVGDADANGNVSGLTHLVAGTVVPAVLDGALLGDFVVSVGHSIALGADYALAEDVCVGLPYRAKARTLPPEGGNPGGSSFGFKAHNVEIAVRLNNSACPLVNGARATRAQPLSTEKDAPEVLITDDVVASNVDVDDGTVLIEQDLPFRTEICAIGGKRQINKV